MNASTLSSTPAHNPNAYDSDYRDEHSLNGIEFTSHASSGGDLIVELSEEASEAWGAHLDAGIETRDCGAWRRSARRLVEQLALRDGFVHVEIYACQSGAQDWVVDAFDLD